VTFRGLKKHLCDLAQQKRLKARKSESEARRGGYNQMFGCN
jgi:hypothetical protein